MAWLHEQGYAKSTIARRAAAVALLVRIYVPARHAGEQPGRCLTRAGQDKKLPHFLSEADMGKLLGTAPADTPDGVRDRAILETLYSAGLRVSELVG